MCTVGLSYLHFFNKFSPRVGWVGGGGGGEYRVVLTSYIGCVAEVTDT